MLLCYLNTLVIRGKENRRIHCITPSDANCSLGGLKDIGPETKKKTGPTKINKKKLPEKLSQANKIMLSYFDGNICFPSSW